MDYNIPRNISEILINLKRHLIRMRFYHFARARVQTNMLENPPAGGGNC